MISSWVDKHHLMLIQDLRHKDKKIICRSHMLVLKSKSTLVEQVRCIGKTQNLINQIDSTINNPLNRKDINRLLVAQIHLMMKENGRY